MVATRPGRGRKPSEMNFERRSSCQLGSVAIAMAKYDDTRREVEQALTLFHPQKTSLHAARALINLSTALFYQGEFEKGTTCSQQALQICEQLGDHYRLLVTLSNLGIDKEILRAGD